jgi:hypothetical protein
MMYVFSLLRSGWQNDLVIYNLTLFINGDLSGVVCELVFTDVHTKVFKDLIVDVSANVIVAGKIFTLCQSVACTQNVKYSLWVFFTHATYIIIAIFEDVFFMVFSE